MCCQRHYGFLGEILLRQFPCDFSLAHNVAAVAHIDYLRKLGGYHDYGRSVFRELVYDGVDLSLGAYVDTPCGLVKDDYLWTVCKPLT